MIEDQLRRLGALPKPELGPFFAARVTSLAKSGQRRRRVPLLLTVYWIVVAALAASMLASSWAGTFLIVVAIVAIAFPAGALRLVLSAAGPLVRSPK